MSTRSRTVGSPDATRAVDWEQRIDYPRLRRERLERAKAALEASDLEALLLFDPNNIRYVASTHIGEWARDKNARFALLPRSADPISWDSCSAARQHQLFAPWLPLENFRAGVAPMRGAMPVETGIPDRPEEGMVFALETYRAATDGRSAARIEEEVVVTATGCDVIARFPADELLVAGRMYVRGADLVRGGDNGENDGTPSLAAAVASSAVVEPVTVPR